MTEYSVEIDQAQMRNLFEKLDAIKRPTVIREGLRLGAFHITSWIKKRRLSGRRFTYRQFEGLNVQTGRLRSSISASGVIQTGNEYKVKIGTNVVYAPTHEFGDQRRGIPRRPFLGVAVEDEDNQQDVLRILTRQISEAIGDKIK